MNWIKINTIPDNFYTQTNFYFIFSILHSVLDRISLTYTHYITTIFVLSALYLFGKVCQYNCYIYHKLHNLFHAESCLFPELRALDSIPDKTRAIGELRGCDMHYVLTEPWKMGLFAQALNQEGHIYKF